MVSDGAIVMKEKNKTLLLILGIFGSLVIVVGVYLLVKKQSEVTPVPTAPPETAQIFEVGEAQDTCSLEFIVEEGESGLKCSSKGVFRGGFQASNKLDPGSTVNPGDTLFYLMNFKNLGTLTSSGGEIVDELPSEVTFLDNETTGTNYAAAGCLYDLTSHTLTCPIGEMTVDSGTNFSFEVQINEDASSGAFTNSFTLTSDEGLVSTCDVDLEILGTSTPTPTPSTPASSTPSPTPTPSAPTTSPVPSELPAAGIMTFTTGTVGAGALLLLLGMLGLLLL